MRGFKETNGAPPEIRMPGNRARPVRAGGRWGPEQGHLANGLPEPMSASMSTAAMVTARDQREGSITITSSVCDRGPFTGRVWVLGAVKDSQRNPPTCADAHWSRSPETGDDLDTVEVIPGE